MEGGREEGERGWEGGGREREGGRRVGEGVKNGRKITINFSTSEKSLHSGILHYILCNGKFCASIIQT